MGGVFIMKRTFIFVLAIEFAIAYWATMPVALGQLQDGPWPMFHHDLKHTGRSPYIGPNSSTLKWSYEANHGIDAPPVVGSDGTIYFGTGNGESYFYALKPDGSLKWSYRLHDRTSPAAAIDANGTIYVGDNQGYFYAFEDRGTEGYLKWSYPTAPAIRTHIFSSAAIGPDNTIYVGVMAYVLNYPTFLALTDSGTLKWSIAKSDVGNIDESSPAIGSDGTIYVGSLEDKLFAIEDSVTFGFIKWSYTTEDDIQSSPSVGSDGTIYVGSNDNKVYAIEDNVTSCSIKWSYTTGGDVISSPAVGADGTIYVGSDDGRFYAIESDGSYKWHYTTGAPDEVRSSPAIDANGVIYVGSYDNKVYAINSDGTCKWSYTTGYDVKSSPAIGPDGTIYVGTDINSTDKKLYAYPGYSEMIVMSIYVP
jgi:outer membrane protein assembly factor BamB